MYKLAMRIREKQLENLIVVKVYCKHKREFISFEAAGKLKYLSTRKHFFDRRIY